MLAIFFVAYDYVGVQICRNIKAQDEPFRSPSHQVDQPNWLLVQEIVNLSCKAELYFFIVHFLKKGC